MSSRPRRSSAASASNGSGSGSGSGKEAAAVASPKRGAAAKAKQQQQAIATSPAKASPAATRGGKRGRGAVRSLAAQFTFGSDSSSAEKGKAKPAAKRGRKPSAAASKRKQRHDDDSSDDDSDDDSDASSDSDGSDEEAEDSDEDSATPSKRGARNSLPGFSLFEHLGKTGASAPQIVDLWLQRRISPTTAGCELINLVLRVAGSPRDLLTMAQFEHLQQEPKLDGFAKRFKSYFLDVRDKKNFARRRALYKQFWIKLADKSQSKFIAKTQQSVLHEFAGRVIAWLTKLSAVAQRPVRHSATMAALDFCSGLVALYAKDLEQVSKHQRLRERYRSKKDTAKEKVEKENIDTLQKRMGATTELIDALFKIFSERYRDVYPEIRASCITTLREWMLALPEKFVQNAYLRYFGWLLNDRQAMVRAKTVESLLKIYSERSLVSNLEDFTTRFSDRFLQLPLDKNVHVAVVGLQLLRTLDQERDWFTNERAEATKEIFRYISDASSSIRNEAARFVFAYRLQPVTAEITDDTTAHARLRALVDLVIEDTLHPKFPNYTIDALWTPCTENAAAEASERMLLLNWPAMSELLLRDRPINMLNLTQQVVLARIIAVCVDKALGFDIYPKHRIASAAAAANAAAADTTTTTTSKAAAAGKAAHAAALLEVTKHFGHRLPAMLRKFRAEPAILQSLLHVAARLRLESFTTERMENDHQELVELLAELLQNQVSGAVLSACTKALGHFAARGNPLREQVLVALSHVSTQLAAEISGNFVNTIKQHGTVDQYSFATWLLRARYAAGIVKLPDLEALHRACQELLEAITRGAVVTPSATESAIKLLGLSLMWSMADISPEAPDLQAVAHLCAKRDAFVHVLDAVASRQGNEHDADGGQSLKRSFVLLILDMVTLFSPRLRGTSLRALAFSAPQQLLEHVRVFFKTQLARAAAELATTSSVPLHEQLAAEADAAAERSHGEQLEYDTLENDPHYLLENLAEGVAMATLAHGLPCDVFSPLLYSCLAKENAPTLHTVAKAFHSRFVLTAQKPDIEHGILEALKSEFLSLPLLQQNRRGAARNDDADGNEDNDGDEENEDSMDTSTRGRKKKTTKKRQAPKRAATKKKPARRGRSKRNDDDDDEDDDEDDEDHEQSEAEDDIEDSDASDSEGSRAKLHEKLATRDSARHLSAFAARLSALFDNPDEHREEIGNIVIGALMFAVDADGGVHLPFLLYFDSFIDKLRRDDAEQVGIKVSEYLRSSSFVELLDDEDPTYEPYRHFAARLDAQKKAGTEASPLRSPKRRLTFPPVARSATDDEAENENENENENEEHEEHAAPDAEDPIEDEETQLSDAAESDHSEQPSDVSSDEEEEEEEEQEEAASDGSDDEHDEEEEAKPTKRGTKRRRGDDGNDAEADDEDADDEPNTTNIRRSKRARRT